MKYAQILSFYGRLGGEVSLCLHLPYCMVQMGHIYSGVFMMYSSVHTVFNPINPYTANVENMVSS